MKDIEIVNDEAGVPTVRLHGDAKAKAAEKGISKVLISLSHSEVSRFSYHHPNQKLIISFQTVAIAFAQASS